MNLRHEAFDLTRVMDRPEKEKRRKRRFHKAWDAFVTEPEQHSWVRERLKRKRRKR